MKTALVIPTIRENCLRDFMSKWNVSNKFDEFIVIEDNPKKTFNLNIKNHYSWEEIDKDLGKDSWIISRKDSSVRSYGLLLAYKLGADYIFTLDDDCYPINEVDNCEFVNNHIDNLINTPKWVEAIPNQRTRGLPYFNKGVNKNVVMSVGLWEGVPDYDSIQTLSGENQKISLPETKVLPVGQYTPICGMNLCFRRDFLPACYWLLQGQGQCFQRFDDIWMGIIAKKIADHLGFSITMGKPYIYHSRASDPMTNLVKEAPGIKFNEIFWEIIENIKLTKENYDTLNCMKTIGSVLTETKDEFGYCNKLGKAITVWCKLIGN